MGYKVSDACLKTLKELSNSFNNNSKKELLKSKNDVLELIMSLGFISMAASTKKDEQTKAMVDRINEAGKELKDHIDELDLGYINNNVY